jgi:hypothetical protein
LNRRAPLCSIEADLFARSNAPRSKGNPGAKPKSEVVADILAAVKEGRT